MSKAFKCDRCKYCFDPYTVDGDFATIKDLYFQNKKNFENREVNYRDEEINLCPDCTHAFNLFMKPLDERKNHSDGDFDGDHIEHGVKLSFKLSPEFEKWLNEPDSQK